MLEKKYIVYMHIVPNGKNCYWYGKHLSNEHKEKLRIKSNKKVIQYDDNFNVINIYDSLTIAAKKYNVTRQAISCCCNEI